MNVPGLLSFPSEYGRVDAGVAFDPDPAVSKIQSSSIHCLTVKATSLWVHPIYSKASAVPAGVTLASDGATAGAPGVAVPAAGDGSGTPTAAKASNIFSSPRSQFSAEPVTNYQDRALSIVQAHLALTVALAGRWGLDLARRGQPQRAVAVDGDAERRGRAADHHAEAARAGPQHARHGRAARPVGRRLVAGHVVHARVQADELRHAARAGRRRLLRRALPRQDPGRHDGQGKATRGGVMTSCRHWLASIDWWERVFTPRVQSGYAVICSDDPVLGRSKLVELGGALLSCQGR